jgi:outer membrane protein TolC
MRDNPLARIERINTDIAASLVRENEPAFDPQARAAYSFSHSRRTAFNESHNLRLSVSESFATTGTDVEVWTSASPSSSALDSSILFQNSVGITVSQSLLQGLSKDVNLAPLRKAKIDINIRQEELAAYAQRLLSDTERAYWDLLLSGEQMSIYKYSLELAQRLLYESEERLKIGGIAPIDLVAIRAEVASRERQLFDAETSFRQKMLYLVYLMGASELWDAEIVPADTTPSLGGADPVSDHLEAARAFRPDYLVAVMQAQKGELDLIQTKNGLLPRLDFFITLQGLSPSESFPAALAPNGDISGAVSGGLTLQLPIKNHTARERHKRTEYSIEQQKLSVENYTRLIEYEIRSAHMEVLRAERQIETAKTVSSLQLQKLEAEQEKMNAGKSTGYAVLQVQRDLVSANLDEAQARTTYIGALITLYSRDGTFLQRRGVKSF